MRRLDQAESLEGAGIGEWVAGAGDADDLELRPDRGVTKDEIDPLQPFLRREDATGDTWPAFVGAVELALAEAALDVAAGSDGEMDAAAGVMIAAETGMIAELFFHHRAG